MGKTSRQPSLIPEKGSGPHSAMELFPAIWGTKVRMLSPDLKERHAGLDDLLASGAERVSPLIAHFLVTRLFDPDIGLQARIIQALAALMRPGDDGSYVPDEVRSQVIGGLVQFGESALENILMAASSQPDLLEDALKLMNYSPQVGKFLQEASADRNRSIETRTLAVTLIGRIGYAEARSELERIRNRIEASHNGQKRMPFAPSPAESESQLLPVIQKALISLSIS
jgi:hypothetical protein